MPSKPISLRISEEIKIDLEQIARRLGTSPGTLGGDYLVQGVRTTKYPSIEFRQTPAGRMAYLRGVRLPVWLAIQTIEECGGKLERAARLLRVPALLLSAAKMYAAAFAEEIEADAAAGNEPLADLEKLVPNHAFLRV